MNHKDLLTIGKLSELSGIHIKALRYYDRIGILPPAHVNEENGYKYYSHEHIYLVEIIKLCAEISIPLKELKKYLSEDGSIENIVDLVDVGIEMVNKRVKEFQDSLIFLKHLKNQNLHSIAIENTQGKTIVNHDARDYWFEPFKGEIGDAEYHKLLGETFEKVSALGLKMDVEMGTAHLVQNCEDKTYVFISLEKNEENSLFKNVYRIPPISYQVRLIADKQLSNIEGEFPELFKKKYDKVLFVVDVLTVQMDRSKHKYEIRCSLPSQNDLPIDMVPSNSGYFESL